jgi:hypothetical protein
VRGYRAGVRPLPLGHALQLGLSALRREAWLAPLGMLVAMLRRGLAWPAAAVAGVLLARGALDGLRAAPLSPEAPLLGALHAVAAPGALATVLGLWLAGVLLGAALRVAWLAGALPALGGALATGAPPRRRFAEGVAFGFLPLLPAALLALALELSGGLFGWTLMGAAARVSAVALRQGAGPSLAAAVAGALTLAVAVPLCLSVVADALVVRAAVRGESASRAARGAARAFLDRPSALVAGALLLAGLAAGTTLGLGALAGAATGFAPGVSPVLLEGPRLMLSALGALLAAALELWWLAALAVLAART